MGLTDHIPRAPRGRSGSVSQPSAGTLNANARPFTPSFGPTTEAGPANTFASIEYEVAEAAGTPIIGVPTSPAMIATDSAAFAAAVIGIALPPESRVSSSPAPMESSVTTAAFAESITSDPVELDAVSTEVTSLPGSAPVPLQSGAPPIIVNLPPTVASVPATASASNPPTGSETDEAHDQETDDGHDGSILTSHTHSSSATLGPDPAAETDAISTQYITVSDLDGETLTNDPSTPGSFIATTPSAESSMDLNSPTHTESTTHADPVWSYHRDADLFVKVNDTNGPVYFKVCSALIAAASPVWRKQIYGGNHPLQDDGKWIIHMTGSKDRAFGLHVVFSIIHYQFSEVPENPTLDEYSDLAAVASHYDCCQVLIPFAKKWLMSYELRSKYDSKPDGKVDEKLLRIYWALGAGFLFVRVLDRVANMATISPTGAFVNHEGIIWDDRDLPQHVIDDMISIRMNKVRRLLSTINEPFDTLINKPNSVGSRFCKSKAQDAKLLCHSTQLGSLMTDLNRVGLLPIPRPEQYRGNVYDLQVLLVSVSVMGYKTPGALPHQDLHAGCGIGHLSFIKDIMDHPGRLSDETIRELQVRGMKCGTFSRDLFSGVILGYDNVEVSLDLRSNQTYYRQRDEDLVEDYTEGSIGHGMIVPEITVEVFDAPTPTVE